MKSRQRFQRKSSFRTFLFAIARHVLFGYWRRKTSVRPMLDFQEISLASLSTSVGTRLGRREDRARLVRALLALPLDQQLLLEMHYWQDMDREQLAEVFEVQTATIGSRLFRARQTLAEQLRGGDPPGSPRTPEELDKWARSLADDDQS